MKWLFLEEISDLAHCPALFLTIHPQVHLDLLAQVSFGLSIFHVSPVDMYNSFCIPCVFRHDLGWFKLTG